jgi:hypothetical protein
MVHGFDTSVGAAFIATIAESHRALPGWRVPLPSPVDRMGINPFTKEPVLFRGTRDPGPDGKPLVPPSLPFQCVLLPPVEDWENRYLALDFTLSHESGLTVADRDSDDGFDREVEIMEERRLCDEPLYGGLDQDGDPRFLWTVPARIFSPLANLAQEDVAGTLREWNNRSQSPNAVEDLEDLRELSLAAVSQARDMFIWQVHAYFRSK